MFVHRGRSCRRPRSGPRSRLQPADPPPGRSSRAARSVLLAQGAVRYWCRRGDSNSHGLPHCPLKTACLPISPRRLVPYFGTSLDFEPAGALSGAAFAGSLAGGAPGAAGTSFAFGAIFSTMPCCITPLGGPCVVAYHVRPRLVAKKTAARIAVVRDRKLAEPVAPKIVPDAPLPKAAPMSAPLPC